jgi:hypothetical protein
LSLSSKSFYSRSNCFNSLSNRMFLCVFSLHLIRFNVARNVVVIFVTETITAITINFKSILLHF